MNQGIKNTRAVRANQTGTRMVKRLEKILPCKTWITNVELKTC